MKPIVSMREALEDPDIFGKVFDGKSWDAWRAWLIALMGERLTKRERIIFEQLTGRPQEPRERVEEAWAISGRRSGKTRSAAILGSYIAGLCDWSDMLAPGERAVLLILSQTTWQATKAFNFLAGIFDQVPALRALVQNETSDTISLSNGVDVEVRPSSFRSIRGASCCGIICDELAYWRSEETSRNPDHEILDAARPALATSGGPLVVISSPYGQSGELWNTYKRHYGPEGDRLILVGRAASRTMNPTLKKKVVDRAYERDPVSAAAEYGAEFRSDVAGYVDAETIEAAVTRGVVVRPPLSTEFYVAFVDPSGGKHDSMTLAIAHMEGERLVLDLIIERKPPFSPESVVDEFAQTMKQYKVHSVVGDRFAGEWPRERFRKCGIEYQVSEQAKSDIYLAFLPLLNSGRVDLLDNQKMIAQFCGLDRRTARGGRDSIDHSRGNHDDICNSVAGVIVNVADNGGRLGEIKISDEVMARISRNKQRNDFCDAHGIPRRPTGAPCFV